MQGAGGPHGCAASLRGPALVCDCCMLRAVRGAIHVHPRNTSTPLTESERVRLRARLSTGASCLRAARPLFNIAARLTRQLLRNATGLFPPLTGASNREISVFQGDVLAAGIARACRMRSLRVLVRVHAGFDVMTRVCRDRPDNRDQGVRCALDLI